MLSFNNLKVKEAKSFKDRLFGLMFKKKINYCLLFRNCKSIHTFFMKINKLTKGDVINITDLNGRSINYYVYEYKVTSADDSSYLKDIEDGGKYITLVTCNYGGKERYIVKAKAK